MNTQNCLQSSPRPGRVYMPGLCKLPQRQSLRMLLGAPQHRQCQGLLQHRRRFRFGRHHLQQLRTTREPAPPLRRQLQGTRNLLYHHKLSPRQKCRRWRRLRLSTRHMPRCHTCPRRLQMLSYRLLRLESCRWQPGLSRFHRSGTEWIRAGRDRKIPAHKGCTMSFHRAALCRGCMVDTQKPLATKMFLPRSPNKKRPPPQRTFRLDNQSSPSCRKLPAGKFLDVVPGNR